jgi:hypothetical protein
VAQFAIIGEVHRWRTSARIRAGRQDRRMRRPSELPAGLGAAPFSRAAALALGVSPRRLRAGDLDSPFYGIRQFVDAADDIAWKCRAYRERMRPDAAFSHGTAARLLGLPLPLYLPGLSLDVSIPRGHRPATGAGVVGHEVARRLWAVRDLVHRDFARDAMFVLPIVSAALMWCQLADSLDLDDLVAVGDALVTGQFATADELRLAAAAWAGNRGAKKLRQAAEDVRPGPLSRPESLIRLQAMRAGIPEPRLNHTVQGFSGEDLAMTDLCWPEFHTLVEYEGDYHRSSRAKFRSDITRMEMFTDGGWAGLRAHADDVFGDPNPFVARLWRRLEQRGWHPPTPRPLWVAPARR